MSRLYEALKQMENERRPASEPAKEPRARIGEFLSDVLTEKVCTDERLPSEVEFSPARALVALNDPHSLGAEKFRALATRLENLRRQREMKSLQVTSGAVGEGKTLVAGNLAATLAYQCSSRVLLVEGDLDRPALTPLLGIREMPGIGRWWTDQNTDIANFVHRLKGLPLWFIDAESCAQPAQILRSSRFMEAFGRLVDLFDWIIVDSAPMLPTTTVNLWARLVDGALLVVREGVASAKHLKKGIEALDNPKLVGIVLNEASELREENYSDYRQAGEQKTPKVS